jgi:hypothetical protein
MKETPMTHADRDHSECRVNPPTDERVQPYAEAIRSPAAFVERRRVEGAYFGSSRTAWETLSEWQTRAVMAVADAEMQPHLDELSARADLITRLEAEVERLEAVADHSASLAAFTAERFRAACDRAEAAERALADERAKVARVEALCEAADLRFDEPRLWTSEIRAALAGPEPEATITPGGMPVCPECGRWGSATAAGLCLNSFHDGRAVATEGGDE